MRRGATRIFAAYIAACLIAVAIVVASGVFAPSALADESQTQSSTTSAVAGNGSSPTTVRVGFFKNGDFMRLSDDGSYDGYDVEYYYTIAGYANWDVQFVQYDSLNSALAALESGDIDVMSGLSITNDRQSKYLISNLKMCTAHIAVQTRTDDTRFAAGDTDTMKDMTCGILAGSNVVTLYTNWCESNGLVPHIKEYASIDLRNAALQAGEVDAIAGGSSVEGAQKIAEFPSLDLYFMFNKNRADLKSQLDRAMSILSLENPSYASNLFMKYFPSTKNPTPSFSAAEQAFIAAHPVIKVAVLEDDAPFSSASPSGSVKGILPDYFAHLSDVIGSEFECVPYATKEDACAALAAGEVDMVGKFQNDIFDANERKVILTIPYLKMNMVQITRNGTDEVHSAAVPQCNVDGISKVLDKQGSNITITTCLNSVECFNQLKSGAVDSVICTQPAATWLLYRNRASDYVVLAFGSDTWDATCAISYGESGNTLRSIIDKTVAVDDGYINQLITSKTLDDSADLSTVFDRFPVSVLATAAIIAIILLGIAAVAIVIIIRRRKVERELDRQRAELAAAEEINSARHAFFGAVSHDMRTPLNGIIGFSNLALESNDLVTIKDDLQKIRKSGTVLNGLINDMLVMSRIENGKYTLKPAACRTTDILEEVLDPIEELASEKDVMLETKISDECPRWVLVDRLSLQKLILNLLSNAVKFTPSGGTVVLKCQHDLDGPNGPDTLLSVSDTGARISKEQLSHVFEPFWQENPDNADTSGSGMGLSIVKSIVDAMGGTIDVQSEKGKGTIFTVRLHLEEAPETPEKPASETEDLSRLSGKHVLLCEDNALNLEIAKSVLEHYGVEVTSFENGKLGVEAFEASAPGSFDAVLLDLRMPVMDGKSAAKAIRALDRSDAKTVAIVAISADAFEKDVQECLDAGMNGHIAKPIDSQKLYEVLAGLIG